MCYGGHLLASGSSLSLGPVKKDNLVVVVKLMDDDYECNATLFTIVYCKKNFEFDRFS